MRNVICFAAMIGMVLPVFGDLELTDDAKRSASTTYLADSPAAAELLEESQRLLKEEQYEAAAESLQDIVNDYGGRLLLDDAKRYVDARHRVWDTLRSSPKLLRAYEKRYGSVASRELERAITPLIDETQLAELAQRYAMTRAGLEATLNLAAVQLQQGNFDYASLLLRQAERHPFAERGESKRRLLQMLAFVAAARGDDTVETDVQRYIEAGGRDGELLTEILESVQQRGETLSGRQNLRWPADQDVPSLARPSWQRTAQLWEHNEPLTERRGQPQPILINRQGMGMAFSPSGQGSSATVTITPSRDLLIIYNALGIAAWDQSSGRERWAHRSTLPQHLARLSRRQLLDQLENMRPEPPLIENEVVYAPSTWSGSRYGSIMFRSISAHDVNTGKLLWQTDPHEIDPILRNALFHGTPIMQGGRLFVLMSRMQSGGFQELFVVALDPPTGKPLWHRHIASSSLAGVSQAMSGKESLLNGQGRIYVSNGQGVVASISAMDGSVLWARFFESDLPVNFRNRHIFGRRQLTLSPSLMHQLQPVRIDAGLILPVTWQQAGLSLMRVDPFDGAVLDERLVFGEGDVLSLRTYDGDLLVLQDETGLTRYDGTTLEEIWSIDVASEDVQDASLQTLGRIGALATQDDLIMFDLEKGEVLQRRPLTMPARITLSPGQLVMVQSDMVSSFMAWDLALKRLAMQMSQRPFDPNPGLALARMAFNEDRLEELEQGMEHAVASLALTREDREELQQHVFDDLMELGRDTSVSEQAKMADAVYRRLAEIVNSPQQQVERLMAHGEHFARSERPQDAVDAYQTILLTDDLADQSIHIDKLIRAAGMMAQQRLKRLIQEHGREVYNKYETQAVSELIEAREAQNVEDLVEVSKRYPVSRTAVEALATAGDLLTERDELTMASEFYRQALRLKPEVSMVPSLASRMVTVYEKSGQIRQAAYWLRRLDREYPALTLMRASVETTPQQWLETLSGRQNISSEPSVALPLGDPSKFAGGLMRPLITSVEQTVQPGFLLREGDKLHFHRGTDGTRAWTVERETARLLTMDDSQILLYSPEADEIEALNTATGHSLWPRIKVGDAMEAVAPLQGQGNEQHQHEFDRGRPIVVNIDGVNQRAVIGSDEDPQTGVNLIFASGPLNLAVSDRMGRVMLIDRMSGEIRWRKATSIHLPLALAMSDEQVAVAGSVDLREVRRWRNVAAGNGQLQLISGEGGVVTLGMDHGEQGMAARQRTAPFFVAFQDPQTVVTVAARDIVAYATDEQRIVWHRDCSEDTLGPAAWMHGDRLLAMERQGGMSIFNAHSGTWIRRLSLQSDAMVSPVGVLVKTLNEQWYMCLPKRLLAVNEEGLVKWQDGLYRDRDTAVTSMLVSKSNLFAIQRVRGVGTSSQWTVMVMNLQNGLIEESFRLPETSKMRVDSQGFARQPLSHAVFIENGVVFSAGEMTMMLKGSNASP